VRGGIPRDLLDFRYADMRHVTHVASDNAPSHGFNLPLPFSFPPLRGGYGHQKVSAKGVGSRFLLGFRAGFSGNPSLLNFLEICAKIAISRLEVIV